MKTNTQTAATRTKIRVDRHYFTDKQCLGEIYQVFKAAGIHCTLIHSETGHKAAIDFIRNAAINHQNLLED